MSRIYIGRLPWGVGERDIAKFLDGYGRIVDIVMKNGYAFVELSSKKDAEDAVRDLDNKRLWGERVPVEIAKSKPWTERTRYRSRSRDRRRSRSRTRSRSRSRDRRRKRSRTRSRSKEGRRSKRSRSKSSSRDRKRRSRTKSSSDRSVSRSPKRRSPRKSSSTSSSPPRKTSREEERGKSSTSPETGKSVKINANGMDEESLRDLLQKKYGSVRSLKIFNGKAEVLFVRPSDGELCRREMSDEAERVPQQEEGEDSNVTAEADAGQSVGDEESRDNYDDENSKTGSEQTGEGEEENGGEEEEASGEDADENSQDHKDTNGNERKRVSNVHEDADGEEESNDAPATKKKREEEVAEADSAEAVATE